MIISLINPEDLSDKRLKTEFKYILPLIKKAKAEFRCRGYHSFVNSDNFPLGYVTGMGSDNFFFNKIKYLYRRYNDILLELGERELLSDDKLKRKVINLSKKRKLVPEHMWGSYTPTNLDIQKSVHHVIQERNKKKYTRQMKETYSKYL